MPTKIQALCDFKAVKQTRVFFLFKQIISGGCFIDLYYLNYKILLSHASACDVCIDSRSQQWAMGVTSLGRLLGAI